MKDAFHKHVTKYDVTTDHANALSRIFSKQLWTKCAVKAQRSPRRLLALKKAYLKVILPESDRLQQTEFQALSNSCVRIEMTGAS